MAAFVLVLQIAMVGQRWLVTNIRVFAAQSLLLAGIANTIAYFNHAPHIYIAAFLTFTVKAVALPILLERSAAANLGHNTLAVAVSLFLIGFYMMITRRKAIMQVLALLSLENGLFLAAISLTYGMPLIIELGIFFDLLVAVMVLGILVYRIQETFDSMDVSKLSRLRG